MMVWAFFNSSSSYCWCSLQLSYFQFPLRDWTLPKRIFSSKSLTLRSWSWNDKRIFHSMLKRIINLFYLLTFYWYGQAFLNLIATVQRINYFELTNNIIGAIEINREFCDFTAKLQFYRGICREDFTAKYKLHVRVIAVPRNLGLT